MNNNITDADFIEVYNSTYKQLTSYVYGKIKSTQNEDIVQETYRRWWIAKRGNKISHDYNLQWLMLTAKRLFLKEIQRQNRLVGCIDLNHNYEVNLICGEALEAPRTEVDQSPQHSPTPFTAILDKETQEIVGVRLGKVMDKLTKRQKDVVRLRYIEGLSYKDVGESLKISVMNVGYVLNQALTKMRKQLTRGNDDV